jgi:protein-L-isoaspartate(D-aspartate) O-methyltransferase
MSHGHEHGQSHGKTRGIGMTSARTRDRLVQRLGDTGIASPFILERIRNVPRHLFVDEALASRAYEDSALPIGQGQTISQPWVVARMTEAIVIGPDNQPRPLRKVLEVGTGCGYQTAVLSPFARQLYTIERIGALQAAARQRLNQLGFDNVRYRHGDGFQGWPGQAPFDAILVAAAPGDVPPALLEQLAVGGRLVIPIGPPGQQDLLRVTRTEQGYQREPLSRVSFVPLVEGTV